MCHIWLTFWVLQRKIRAFCFYTSILSMEVFGLNLEQIFVDLAHRRQVKNCIEGVRDRNIKSGY